MVYIMVTVRFRPLELLLLLEPFCFRGPMATLGVGTSVSEYFFSFCCNATFRRNAFSRILSVGVSFVFTTGLLFNRTFFTGFVVGAGFRGFPVFIKAIAS
jgi:hypothetical protein